MKIRISKKTAISMLITTAMVGGIIMEKTIKYEWIEIIWYTPFWYIIGVTTSKW